MRVTTKIVFDIAGNVLEHEWHEYDGPVSECKGATDSEKSTAQSQTDFMNQLMGNYATQFGNQSAILKSISDSVTPTLLAGPNQFGYSKQQEGALRTQASEGTAGTYKMAKQATGESLAAVGGGNVFLPSGVKAGLTAQNANAAAALESNQQLGITNQGYELGRQNYGNAIGALSNVASQYSPLGYAGAGTNAGQAAFGSESEIQKADAAASPWATIGGLLGGGASSFLGGYGSALGKGAGEGASSAASGLTDLAGLMV